jgi:NAD(P)-dependent dehydrogenase (short-subunit alcohol dehydrogenase family)
MVLHRVISPQIIRKLYATMKSAVKLFWTEYLQADGAPEDFAGPAVFLSSSASDYVDGTILTVDGGWMGR